MGGVFGVLIPPHSPRRPPGSLFKVFLGEGDILDEDGRVDVEEDAKEDLGKKKGG